MTAPAGRERIEHGGFLVRTFEPADAAPAWRLHVEGLRDMNTWSAHDRDPQWDADVRAIPEHYLTPGSHFWVVEDGGAVIATSAVRRIDDATAEIKRMRVAKTHRRRGVARLLVAIAEDFCRRHGYRRIILDTTDRQQPPNASTNHSTTPAPTKNRSPPSA